LIIVITLSKMSLSTLVEDGPNFMHLNFATALILMAVFGVLIKANHFSTASFDFTIPVLLIRCSFVSTTVLL